MGPGYPKKQYGGSGIPNIVEMNLSLLDSWVYKYYKGDQKSGNRLLNLNIEPIIPTSSPALILIPLLSGKVFCGQLKLPNMVYSGKWGMAKELSFGRTTGSDHVAWLSNFGSYIT